MNASVAAQHSERSNSPFIRAMILTPGHAHASASPPVIRIEVHGLAWKHGRRVHDEEYGPFLGFVKAALAPFKEAQGCDAVINVVLTGLNDVSGNKGAVA
jgi:hypothetical protein